MKQIVEILRTTYLDILVQRNLEKAKRYEQLARENCGGVEGDLALHLMMRYKDRADRLIHAMR